MNQEELFRQYFLVMDTVNRGFSLTAIGQAVDILYDAWQRESAVYLMGNGGSASTATHFASDLAKYTLAPGKKRVRALALVDNIPLVSAWTNDAGFGSVFVEQLEPWLKKDDVLIGLSVHGGSGDGGAGPWSQNLVQAMDLAKKRGATTIAMAGFSGGALKQMADVCILVPVTEEPMGTPLIESYHVLLHHLICLALKLRIAEANGA